MAEVYLAREFLNPEAAALLGPLLTLSSDYTLVFSPLAPPRTGKEVEPLLLVLAAHGCWLLSFQPALQPQAVPHTLRRTEDNTPGPEEAIGLLRQRRQQLERFLAERGLGPAAALKELLVLGDAPLKGLPRDVATVTAGQVLATLQQPTGGSLTAERRHEIAVALQEERELARVNQYQLVVRLSGGPPPVSHLAYDTLLERPVQLEEYPYDSLSQPGQRDFVQHEIIREAKLTMQLHHESISRVEQIISQEDRLWVVTEWSPRSLTLRDCLRLRGAQGPGTVPTDAAIDIVIDLCKALEYSHNKGVVHRHVRPENVLIMPNGRAKLTNFGLAKKADMGTRPTYDLRQMIKENPYAAPEFHLGKEGHHLVDGRVDIYSVGIIFYELLTGGVPGHLDERFWEPPSQANPALGTDFDDLIARAVKFDPAQRYSTIGTLRRLLERRPEALQSEQSRRRYLDRRLLRRTRNSLIFSSFDARLSRTVTLKKVLLAPNLTAATRDEALQALLSEAQLASQLNHPNIVTIYDYFIEDDDGYIVMEMVEGPTLREILESEGAVDMPILLDLLEQLLDALAYAHRQGIVHRDIKPENIVYHGGKVTLLDFGLADVVQGTNTRLDDQKTGGTARYMAPEQLQGIPVDTRADIFALGVLMYELLTKHYPYSPDIILSRFLTDHIIRPVPPSEINLNIPPSIDQVILQALEITPESRFQSLEEIQHALANLGNDPLVFSPLPEPEEGARVPWVEVLGLVAIGLVLATVAVVIYTHWMAPARHPRTQSIVLASESPSGSESPGVSPSVSASVAASPTAAPTPSPRASLAPPPPPSWAGRPVEVDRVAVQVAKLQSLPDTHSTAIILKVTNRSDDPISFLNRSDRPELVSLSDNLGNDYSNLVDIRSVSPELLLIQPGQTVTGSFQVKDALDPAATSLTLLLREYGERGREFPLSVFKIEAEPGSASTSSP